MPARLADGLGRERWPWRGSIHTIRPAPGFAYPEIGFPASASGKEVRLRLPKQATDAFTAVGGRQLARCAALLSVAQAVAMLPRIKKSGPIKMLVKCIKKV